MNERKQKGKKIAKETGNVEIKSVLILYDHLFGRKKKSVISSKISKVRRRLIHRII